MTGSDAGAMEFRLPDLGEGLTEAEITAWLVRLGDPVEVDQPVVVVETGKATVELPSPCAGVVTRVHGGVGDVVEVGHLLLVVSPTSQEVFAEPQPAPHPEAPTPALVGSGTTPKEVRRTRVRPPGAPAGPDGPHDSGHPGDGVRTRLGGRRRAAADKVTRSRREIPDATCWVESEASGLMAAREALRHSGVGLLALLARITVAGLRRFPELNGHFDPEAGEAVRFEAVHLGIATDTPRGLLIPVVRDAHTRTTAELAAEIERLTGAARAGRLGPSDSTGSTMTLNNYGVFGVDGSVPILNHPEVAMLGVGRIVRKPWVVGDGLAVRPAVQLSVTFDHRVCDGGPPSRFLRFVADCVEEPARLLREV